MGREEERRAKQRECLVSCRTLKDVHVYFSAALFDFRPTAAEFPSINYLTPVLYTLLYSHLGTI